MPKPNERGKPRGVIFMFNCPCGIEHRIDIEKAGLKMLFIDTCKGREPNMALVKHYMREPTPAKTADSIPKKTPEPPTDPGSQVTQDAEPFYVEIGRRAEKKSGSPGTPSQKNQGAGGNKTGNETL